MNDWRWLTLAEIGEVTAGNPAPQAQNDFSEDGAPFVRMQDVGRQHITENLCETTDRVTDDAVRRHKLRLFPAGSLLIPKSGASVNLNHRALLGTNAYVVSHLAVVVPDVRQVLPEYLFYWSQVYDPRHQAQVTSLPSLPLALIAAALVPVPPISEQRRIVDILYHANSIRRLRREAQEKARQVIPALFVNMFGDPAQNPRGWERRRLGDLVGISAPLRTPNQKSEAETPCIGPDCIEAETGQLVAVTTVAEVMPRSGKYAFDARDVLYSKIRPYLAKATIAAQSGYCSADMYPLKVGKLVVPEFVLWLLLSKAFTSFATDASVRARMPKLNRETLFSYEALLPPVRLQSDFAERVADMQSIIAQQDRMSTASDQMVSALMAKMFA